MPARGYHLVWVPARSGRDPAACANHVDELQFEASMFCQLNWHPPSSMAQNERGTRLASSRRVMSRSVRYRCLLGMGAALVTGCLSPTMPMPPPSRPDIEGPNEQGVVVLSGRTVPESTIFAANESTPYVYGYQTDNVTGYYRLPILASVGDSIAMWYRLDTEDSMVLKFVIPSESSYPRGTGGAAGASNSGANSGANSGGNGGALGADGGSGGNGGALGADGGAAGVANGDLSSGGAAGSS
jgi:hypothetical protein